MKAKESASEPSRKGRLSLGWSGKGGVRTREKKSRFNRRVGSGGRTKTGIEEERVKGAL